MPRLIISFAIVPFLYLSVCLFSDQSFAADIPALVLQARKSGPITKADHETIVSALNQISNSDYSNLTPNDAIYFITTSMLHLSNINKRPPDSDLQEHLKKTKSPIWPKDYFTFWVDLACEKMKYLTEEKPKQLFDLMDANTKGLEIAWPDLERQRKFLEKWSDEVRNFVGWKPHHIFGFPKRVADLLEVADKTKSKFGAHFGLGKPASIKVKKYEHPLQVRYREFQAFMKFLKSWYPELAHSWPQQMHGLLELRGKRESTEIGLLSLTEPIEKLEYLEKIGFKIPEKLDFDTPRILKQMKALAGSESHRRLPNGEQKGLSKQVEPQVIPSLGAELVRRLATLQVTDKNSPELKSNLENWLKDALPLIQKTGNADSFALPEVLSVLRSLVGLHQKNNIDFTAFEFAAAVRKRVGSESRNSQSVNPLQLVIQLNLACDHLRDLIQTSTDSVKKGIELQAIQDLRKSIQSQSPFSIQTLVMPTSTHPKFPPNGKSLREISEQGSLSDEDIQKAQSLIAGFRTENFEVAKRNPITSLVKLGHLSSYLERLLRLDRGKEIRLPENFFEFWLSAAAELTKLVWQTHDGVSPLGVLFDTMDAHVKLLRIASTQPGHPTAAELKKEKVFLSQWKESIFDENANWTDTAILLFPDKIMGPAIFFSNRSESSNEDPMKFLGSWYKEVLDSWMKKAYPLLDTDEASIEIQGIAGRLITLKRTFPKSLSDTGFWTKLSSDIEEKYGPKLFLATEIRNIVSELQKQKKDPDVESPFADQSTLTQVDVSRVLLGFKQIKETTSETMEKDVVSHFNSHVDSIFAFSIYSERDQNDLLPPHFKSEFREFWFTRAIQLMKIEKDPQGDDLKDINDLLRLLLAAYIHYIELFGVSEDEVQQYLSTWYQLATRWSAFWNHEQTLTFHESIFAIASFAHQAKSSGASSEAEKVFLHVFEDWYPNVIKFWEDKVTPLLLAEKVSANDLRQILSVMEATYPGYAPKTLTAHLDRLSQNQETKSNTIVKKSIKTIAFQPALSDSDIAFVQNYIDRFSSGGIDETKGPIANLKAMSSLFDYIQAILKLDNANKIQIPREFYSTWLSSAAKFVPLVWKPSSSMAGVDPLEVLAQTMTSNNWLVQQASRTQKLDFEKEKNFLTQWLASVTTARDSALWTPTQVQLFPKTIIGMAVFFSNLKQDLLTQRQSPDVMRKRAALDEFWKFLGTWYNEALTFWSEKGKALLISEKLTPDGISDMAARLITLDQNFNRCINDVGFWKLLKNRLSPTSPLSNQLRQITLRPKRVIKAPRFAKKETSRTVSPKPKSTLKSPSPSEVLVEAVASENDKKSGTTSTDISSATSETSVLSPSTLSSSSRLASVGQSPSSKAVDTIDSDIPPPPPDTPPSPPREPKRLKPKLAKPPKWNAALNQGRTALSQPGQLDRAKQHFQSAVRDGSWEASALLADLDKDGRGTQQSKYKRAGRRYQQALDRLQVSGDDQQSEFTNASGQVVKAFDYLNKQIETISKIESQQCELKNQEKDREVQTNRVQLKEAYAKLSERRAYLRALDAEDANNPTAEMCSSIAAGMKQGPSEGQKEDLKEDNGSQPKKTLAALLQEHSEWKEIIAPHEIEARAKTYPSQEVVKRLLGLGHLRLLQLSKNYPDPSEEEREFQSAMKNLKEAASGNKGDPISQVVLGQIYEGSYPGGSLPLPADSTNARKVFEYYGMAAEQDYDKNTPEENSYISIAKLKMSNLFQRCYKRDPKIAETFAREAQAEMKSNRQFFSH